MAKKLGRRGNVNQNVVHKGQEAAIESDGSVETAPTDIPQVVDPSVSREKFESEISEFQRLEEEHRRRGWWMLDSAFPTVFVAMLAIQLRPVAVVCGVLIDFSNYDLDPPSVRLVDPITRVPYRARDLPTVLHRRQVLEIPGAAAGAQMVGAVPLMQAHAPEDIPFLCVPGVREYHNHPAHTGDSWLAHRGKGSGKLFSILHTIYQYGIQPISDYGIGMRVVGFQQNEPPL
jgi:hypothetical protein